jgi:hypothetical protein
VVFAIGPETENILIIISVILSDKMKKSHKFMRQSLQSQTSYTSRIRSEQCSDTFMGDFWTTRKIKSLQTPQRFRQLLQIGIIYHDSRLARDEIRALLSRIQSRHLADECKTFQTSLRVTQPSLHRPYHRTTGHDQGNAHQRAEVPQLVRIIVPTAIPIDLQLFEPLALL